MYVWTISSSSERDPANRIASYIRRVFKVIQIIYSDKSHKRPYKAFLLYSNNLEDIEEGYIANIDEKIFDKNLYEIICKIPEKKLKIIKSILYGNTDNLLEIKGKKIFFEIIISAENKLILKNAFDAKTKKKIELNEKDLQFAICNLIKEL